MDVEMGDQRPVAAKIQNLSLGGAKIQLPRAHLGLLENQVMGGDITLKLVIPESISHLILYPSPVMAKAKVVRKNTQQCQLGVVWTDIHPVVLSALIHLSKTQ